MDAGTADAQPATDAGMVDAGEQDSGAVDAGQPDAAADAGQPDSGEADAGQPDSGEFMPPSIGSWEKYEPAGAVCSDGSPYKVFVNFSGTSDNVVIFFEGGGACWDYASCTGNGARAAANPNGVPDTHASAYTSFGGISLGADAVYPLLSNNSRVNPMADWNKVFMPYCTGDVFSGDTTVTYEDPDGLQPDVQFHHVGHRNVLRSVEMLTTMFDDIPKMFMSGCSAGGAGSYTNYHAVRGGLNVGTGYLLNDSGPIFPDQAATAHSQPLHDRVRQSWNLDTLVDGAPMSSAIQADFGAIGDVLALTYPQDRLAYSAFRLDYNYSLYSYERFFTVTSSGAIGPEGDGRGLGGLGLDETVWQDRAAVYKLWWEDTDLLRDQFDAHANLGYFMPFYRDTNNSHCLTIPGFEEFPPEELPGLFAGDFNRLAWAGTDMETAAGTMNLKDYVIHLLDDGTALGSFFEDTSEGRYLSCTPDPVDYDEMLCAAEH